MNGTGFSPCRLEKRVRPGTLGVERSELNIERSAPREHWHFLRVSALSTGLMQSNVNHEIYEMKFRVFRGDCCCLSRLNRLVGAEFAAG